MKTYTIDSLIKENGNITFCGFADKAEFDFTVNQVVFEIFVDDNYMRESVEETFNGEYHSRDTKLSWEAFYDNAEYFGECFTHFLRYREAQGVFQSIHIALNKILRAS
jgi:hypothetical protein